MEMGTKCFVAGRNSSIKLAKILIHFLGDTTPVRANVYLAKSLIFNQRKKKRFFFKCQLSIHRWFHIEFHFPIHLVFNFWTHSHQIEPSVCNYETIQKALLPEWTIQTEFHQNWVKRANVILATWIKCKATVINGEGVDTTEHVFVCWFFVLV